jgi:predicted RNA-binding protein with PUA domain
MYDNNYLTHYGIKGMRWGVRRFQNEDGSLTRRGKKKYGTKEAFNKVKKAKQASKQAKSAVKKAKNVRPKTAAEKKAAGRKRTAAIIAGSVGALVAEDYVTAAMTGTPNLHQSVRLLFNAVKFASGKG